ncbi:MAG TPA: polyprenyl synthetase family protein [Firmicutes bacterium]|nr:polyprenyl synthetase family protein [Bacillota bacterium]
MLREYQAVIEPALVKYLDAAGREDAVAGAMTYSLTAGGKRIRPALTLAFCRACGGDWEKALPLACALEMIHTYSLIHDDLPCMDNDDMRRGKPSCHKAFGEDTALLAGDGLLTAAFQTILSADLPAETIRQAGLVLARAAGPAGMIGGQVMDLANEGRAVDAARLRETDMLKTGALIRAAAAMGCIAAGAPEELRKAADRYAADIGLAFQIVDDILDTVGDPAALGKAVGSDAANDKSTYVTLLGLEGAKAEAERLRASAVDALAAFGPEADALRELAGLLAGRTY